MRYCQGCGRVNGEDERWCVRCGRSLRDGVLLRGVTDPANQGGGIAERQHRRSLRFSMLSGSLAAAFVQVSLMWLLGRVEGWWLLAHAGAAVVLVRLLYALRLGALSCIALSTAANFALAAASGHLALERFLTYLFALWLLAFWYAFLGAHIDHSHDLDR